MITMITSEIVVICFFFPSPKNMMQRLSCMGLTGTWWETHPYTQQMPAPGTSASAHPGGRAPLVPPVGISGSVWLCDEGGKNLELAVQRLLGKRLLETVVLTFLGLWQSGDLGTLQLDWAEYQKEKAFSILQN